METFGNVSSDGHGQLVDESPVLDESHFDLHTAPASPPKVDTADFVPPAPLWTPEQEADRQLQPRPHRELSEEEQKRREVFGAFFETVANDSMDQGPIPDRRSLEGCKFEDMPDQPPADPAVDEEEKKAEKYVWYDYSEVKLTPPPLHEDPIGRERRETFNALFTNVEVR